MADLTVTYMGIPLKNPIIVGASGLTSNLKIIRNLEEAGAGAIVCKSLFEEEVQLETLKLKKDIHKDDNRYAEMITIFPDIEEVGPEYHLYWVKETKKAVNIPVIGSLNAINEETWLKYAKLFEAAGVDGLELNLYSTPVFRGPPSAEIEQQQLSLLKKIRETIAIPLSVKLSPYYTNLVQFIRTLAEIGIDGYTLFNRFFQSDININTEEATFPFRFSHKQDNLLPMRFTGLLYGKLNGSLCSSTGIFDAEDVIKLILAGTDTVQIVSTLYRNGISHIPRILAGLQSWMQEKGYHDLDDFRGKLSRENLKERDVWIYKRSQYVRMLMQNSEDLLKQIV